jgi:ATP-dependent Clp protease ATP-binding subunit ClpA
MFERFSDEARSIVQAAPGIARRYNKSEIRLEHLLLALLETRDCLAARVLAERGLEADSAARAISGADDDNSQPDPLDAEALSSIGIDLAAIKDKVEDAFGKGALDSDPHRTPKGCLVPGHHVPFSPGTKKALELSLREALRLGHPYIGDGHVLLGLIRGDAPEVNRILDEAGISVGELRDELDRRIPSRPGPTAHGSVSTGE